MKEGRFKIICTDNYARDTVSDNLVCDNLNSYYGKLIVDFLCDREHENSPNYYKLVDQDHELYVYEL